ncbi:Brix-domain-containing protein [Hysterangium stoloniferum]|nr:Brix-domain-containing protein [Hysterangium stoloniferum]
MLRTVKPKNARSKRAMEAREAKEVEDPRTAIFVRGTHPGEKVVNVMTDLMALKRPHAVSFSKKNAIYPFEDPSSLEFWAQKNDASFFVVGQSTKKRPDGIVLARMFDGKVLDMCELGVEGYVPISRISGEKATPGHTPLMHFASEQFDSNPRFAQLKSLLLDLFSAGEVGDGIHLKGIEHVISVTVSPSSSSSTATVAATATTDLPPTSTSASNATLPKVHLRTYTISFQKSGARTPYVALAPHGPSLDLVLRRHTDPEPVLLQQAMKRPKLKKKDVAEGLGKRKRNQEVDEMGDLRGRIHVPKQNLSELDRGSKRMKGLRNKGDDAI